MDFLAPPQPDFDICATMETLVQDPEGIITASNVWPIFEKKLKDQIGKEDTIFKPMSDIFRKIMAQ